MGRAILGISAYFHDSAAALVLDGRIVAAAQEERFTRKKHDARFPRHAVAYCLEAAGLSARDLDHVAFYENPLLKFERLAETYAAYAPRGFASLRRALPGWARFKLRLPERIRAELGGEYRGPVHVDEHHESHAASAFYPSPFDEAAILTLDAVGEWATSSIGAGRGAAITLLHETRFPHSLGMLYSAFTHYAGFKVNSGEYKLMGLAPYGRPKYARTILDRLVDVRDDGSLWLDMAFFDFAGGSSMTSQRFHQLFGGPPRRPESPITEKEMDLAASVQAVCEQVVLRAARHAHRCTGGNPNLVIAGGVALNCVANGRLLREGPFQRIWIQPAAGDAGGALGAALLVHHRHTGAARRPDPDDAQHGSLLGPAFDEATIALTLDAAGVRYRRIRDEPALLAQVVELLEQEKVVGWFQGRMEFGPRALGARSILGDARSPRMQRMMNLKVKFRESFRPFAPAVLRECADAVFDVRPGDESPYMLFVAPVREHLRVQPRAEDATAMSDPDLRIRVNVVRSRFPAITHVDHSARIQTVDPERHGRFYRLLRAFYERTGSPVLVNTSFNVRGEPIVCSPADALRCFMATGIDCLVAGDHLLLKHEQPAESRLDAVAYRQQFELD